MSSCVSDPFSPLLSSWMPGAPWANAMAVKAGNRPSSAATESARTWFEAGIMIFYLQLLVARFNVGRRGAAAAATRERAAATRRPGLWWRHGSRIRGRRHRKYAARHPPRHVAAQDTAAQA